jgi:hypothetical protein
MTRLVVEHEDLGGPYSEPPEMCDICQDEDRRREDLGIPSIFD